MINLVVNVDDYPNGTDKNYLWNEERKMINVQTLVVTMKKTDYSLYTKMNIQTDAVIGNQCCKYAIEESVIGEYRVKLISTATKGVGLNRNIIFHFSSAEIILFADDDFTFYDGYANKVLKAFMENPKADVIVFNRNLTKDGHIIERGTNKTRRVRIFNCLRYGACSLAVRRKSLLKSRVLFSHLFGGGCIYGSGEDSLFYIDCLKHGLKVFSNEYCVGESSKDGSSWFCGYNKKYFYDKGAWIAAALPSCKLFLYLYFCMRYRDESSLSYREMWRYMRLGSKRYGKLQEYSEEELVSK